MPKKSLVRKNNTASKKKSKKLNGDEALEMLNQQLIDSIDNFGRQYAKDVALEDVVFVLFNIANALGIQSNVGPDDLVKTFDESLDFIVSAVQAESNHNEQFIRPAKTKSKPN